MFSISSSFSCHRENEKEEDATIYSGECVQTRCFCSLARLLSVAGSCPPRAWRGQALRGRLAV